MLTDGAKDFIEATAPFQRLAVFVFLAYALAQHIGWLDAGAVTLAFGQALRAHRLSGLPVESP